MVHHGRNDLFAVRPYKYGRFIELIWTDGAGDLWLFTMGETATLIRKLIWAAIVARYRLARFNVGKCG